MSNRHRFGPLLLVFGLIVVVGGGFAWDHTRTYHLATVQPGVLYRDGLQTISPFRNAVRKTGTRTIVALDDDQEWNDAGKKQFQQEARYFSDPANAQLEHIPVKLGGWPRDADIQRFLGIAADPKRQPVLVHCAQGVRRTGMMVAAFQMSILGYDRERAKQSILDFGHSERTIRDVKNFIDAYDPARRVLTKTFADGDE